MSPENEVLQISSYFRARLNQTGSKFGLKFEEPGNYSILIEIDDQVVLASTFPISQADET